MIGFFVLFLSFGLSLANPHFEWDLDRTGESGIPILHVTYPDNAGHDEIVLKQSHLADGDFDTSREESCIFEGTLKNEPEVPVVATGCPGLNFEVQIHSKKLDIPMYKIENGIVQSLDLPVHGSFNDGLRIPGSEIDDNIRNEDSLNRNVPSDGLIMPVSLHWDQSFQDRFGSSSEARARAVLGHTQGAFNWRSSLGTTVRLDIKHVGFKYGLRYLTPSESGLNAAVPFLDADVNSNVLLTNQRNGGTVGIAWVRAVCSSVRYRANINTYTYSSDLQNGYIVAHELGHNLGMGHDFNGSPGSTRRARNGQVCTGISSVMDYVSNRVRWSQCSIDDFNDYYNSVTRQTGRFCLAKSAPTCFDTSRICGLIGKRCSTSAYARNNCKRTCNTC